MAGLRAREMTLTATVACKGAAWHWTTASRLDEQVTTVPVSVTLLAHPSLRESQHRNIWNGGVTNRTDDILIYRLSLCERITDSKTVIKEKRHRFYSLGL